MKAHVLTITILDFDEVGEAGVQAELENARHANRCISPKVHQVVSYELGDWEDSHPLNQIGVDVVKWLEENAQRTS